VFKAKDLWCPEIEAKYLELDILNSYGQNVLRRS
jgi:hypothetical protein